MKMHYGKSVLSVANDMHAIYCAFCEDRGDIYVKIGLTVRPVGRVKELVTACPFRIERFVFSHIGAMNQARAFEKECLKQMPEFRTRGEWFRFKPEDSPRFKEACAKAYASICGRPLKWTEVPPETWQRNPMFYLGS